MFRKLGDAGSSASTSAGAELKDYFNVLLTGKFKMKIFQRVLTAQLFLCLLGFGTAHAEAEDHAHHGHGAAKLSLNHDKKWSTDEPLRHGMETLRVAFAGHLHAIHKGALSAAEFKMLGEKTEAEVANMVAQCKLDPEADAMLHLVIADMVEGADLMVGKTKGKPAAGAHKVVTALNNYGRYFDHPKWKNLR